LPRRDVADDGGAVTDEMIADWESALERDEWPSGWASVGEIVEGKLPGVHRLANGGVITDEDIEKECAEYESGTWEGHLANPRVGEVKRKPDASELERLMGFSPSELEETMAERTQGRADTRGEER
jgi:hypothetical protein